MQQLNPVVKWKHMNASLNISQDKLQINYFNVLKENLLCNYRSYTKQKYMLGGSCASQKIVYGIAG